MILKRSTIRHQTHAIIYILLAVICGVIGVYALRQNNLKMIELRNAVYVADERNADVETALRDLRSFVYSHMNTDLSSGGNAIKPPIQLKYRYERLLAAETQRTEGSNAQIYSEAQAYCEKQDPNSFSGRNRVPCIQDYVQKHGGSVAQAIPDSLYKFDFVSPRWSPDLAGLALLASVCFTFMAGLSLVFHSRVRRYLRD